MTDFIVRALPAGEADGAAPGGRRLLADGPIARLKAYERAGADVLYAPGLSSTEQIAAVCGAVSKPVNVLALGNLSRDEIFAAGAQRISVGGGLAWVGVGAIAAAAEEMRDGGSFASLATPVPIKEWLG
jgi:2-methylisocitrate lyase-like PEP mutase family enzyme